MKKDKIRGIEGWLNVAIVFLGFPIYLHIMSLSYGGIVFSNIKGIIFNFLLFPLALYVSYLFYKKKKKIIPFIIVWAWSFLIFMSVSQFSDIYNYIEKYGISIYSMGSVLEIFSLFIYLIGAIFITLYFLNSDRVKNTFVEK